MCRTIRTVFFVLVATLPIYPSVVIAQTTLTVALYPFVPRMDQFQRAIEAEWAKVQPSIALNFVTSCDWDGGYDMNPPSNADVFVFDAMFFEDFRKANYLEPLDQSEVQGLDDFVPYAIKGVQVKDQYFAIPQLGCTDILFYRSSDQELAAATKFSDVSRALGQCTYTAAIPLVNKGLLIDMGGKTTNAALYLDAAYNITGKITLPSDPTHLNQEAIGVMKTLLAMASLKNATAESSNAYQRSLLFSSGWGRAAVGYTESMSAMNPATLSQISFKVLPLSDNETPPLFYADVIGISPATKSRGTRSLAVQLANVMAAKETMKASIGADSFNPGPQYLMPARPSVFKDLGKSFPQYNQMLTIASSSTARMFTVDGVKAWIPQMAKTIRTTARANYPCGCDFPAAQRIPDDESASAICQTTCSSHGGWNGQWTNDMPWAADGESVCGCNVCPVN